MGGVSFIVAVFVVVMIHQDIGFIWLAFKGYLMQRCTFVRKRGLCSNDSICRQMVVLSIILQQKLFLFCFCFCFKFESLRVQIH